MAHLISNLSTAAAERTPEANALQSQLASALRPRFATRPSPAIALPDAFASVGTIAAGGVEPPAKSPFVLSCSEWIDLQLGMANLDRIAQTMNNIGSELAEPAAQARELAKVWQGTAFPALRQAAIDIRDYGQQIASPGANAGSPSQLSALFQALTAAAGAAKDRARILVDHVMDIERACAALRASVNAFHQRFASQAANASAETQALREEMDGLVANLGGKQEKYHHYVTVAATTVTYAWIPLFGWIVGGTVAGTYGRAAVLEKEGIDKDVGRIAEITRNLTAQDHQLAILMRAAKGLEGMAGSFGRVLPVLQHTQGIWDAIHSDLGALFERRQGMADAAAFAALLELELQVVVEGWREVAAIADDYLRHAEVLAAQEPTPFGRFRTQTSYGDKIFDENHVLTIDLLGVAVNGIPVKDPSFEGKRLFWGWQTDATRQDKPLLADIVFAADSFEGQCTFPAEGRIGWLGKRI